MNHFISNNNKENKSIMEQINQNMLNYTFWNDNNIFNETTNGSSLNEKEDVDNTCDVEDIEKECINNMIEDSISTEADDFIFLSHNDYLNGYNNDNIFHLKRSHIHYTDDERNMIAETDCLLHNILSFDMSKGNDKEDIFNSLENNTNNDNYNNINNNVIDVLTDMNGRLEINAYIVSKNNKDIINEKFEENVSKNKNKNNMDVNEKKIQGFLNYSLNDDIYNDMSDSVLTNNSLIFSINNKLNCCTNNVLSKNNNCLTCEVVDNDINSRFLLENITSEKKSQFFHSYENIFNKQFIAHSEYSTDNNNTNNSHCNRVLKSMIFNLIETIDSDLELFERIIDVISDHHKNKNMAKQAEILESAANGNYVYGNNTVNKCVNKKSMEKMIGNSDMNNKKECLYNSQSYFMNNKNQEDIYNLDTPFYNRMNSLTKLLAARQFASQVDSCRKLYRDEINMYNVIGSTMKGNGYVNGSIITDSYSNLLKNQINADAALEKEQVLSHIKREIKIEIENGTEKGRKNMVERQKKEDNTISHYINDKVSTVKFNFETDVVENSRKLREEINRNKISRNIPMISINEDITKYFTNVNDSEGNKKWNTYNTNGIRNAQVKDLKNFFSESTSKNIPKKFNESLSSESNKNKLWNRGLNSKELNRFSKNTKKNELNLKNNDILNKELCCEKLFKKKNVTMTANKTKGSSSNASSNNNTDFKGSLRTSCKSDISKSNLKSKNNVEITKINASDLKNIITKSDELCLKSILESLYADRILPLLFNLSGRAEEMKCKEIIRNNLLVAYSLYPNEYEVKKAKTGDDHVVMFVNKVVSDDYFIYLNNTEDKYDEKMWKHFAEYLETIAKSDDPKVYEFSGGRYGMAKELKNRNLFFFEKLCLGEICQIVHLSTNKKLIAYEHNFLKPISKCHKYSNAKLGILNVINENKEDFITSMEELKFYIKSLLKYYKGGFNISTLKKKLKTRFNKQICESVFHCIKLIEVLQLEELREICVVDKDLKFIQSVQK